MTNTYVSLKHSTINSGVAMQIYCTSVLTGFNKNNDKIAYANYDDYPSKVQSVSRNNVSYTLQGAKIDQGDLSYANWLSVYNLEHSDADPMILNVQYNGKWLVDSLGATTDIPVTVDGTNTVTFSTVDSNKAYMPTLSIKLVEAK